MKSWNRKLWGVEFTTDEPPILIGLSWRHELANLRPYYPGEPTRALLFTTRNEARKWCAAKNAEYAQRSDFVAQWRHRPVRVIETVRKP